MASGFRMGTYMSDQREFEEEKCVNCQHTRDMHRGTVTDDDGIRRKCCCSLACQCMAFSADREVLELEA